MMFKSSDPQIYPKHKDLYNWVDVDQRVYVPFNMSYLQESFGYVSKSSNASLHRDFFRGKATWSRFVPGLDKVGDAAAAIGIGPLTRISWSTFTSPPRATSAALANC